MSKKKILLIDDEVAFTQLVKLNLEQTGLYEVRVENKARQAVAAARDFKPDGVLLDIIMPDMEGSEVARQLRQDANLKDVPVGFLTATVMKEETQSQGGRIGGYPFIAKPVTDKELSDFIAALV